MDGLKKMAYSSFAAYNCALSFGMLQKREFILNYNTKNVNIKASFRFEKHL
jgi:hypothetical protein